MRPRRIIAVIFLAVLVIAAIYRLTPREPEYKGRSLSSWLQVLDDGQRYNGLPWQAWEQKPGRTEAGEAIRQMGTNTMPYLFHALTNQDSALKKKFIALLGKQTHVKIPIHLAEDDRRTAELAFHALGPAASNAVPEMRKLLEDTDPSGNDFNGYIASALAGIGPEGWGALTQALKSSNSWVTVCSSWALGSHRAAVPGTVDALINQVTNTTSGGSAALAQWALAAIGQDSGRVVPVLIHSLQSSSASDVRWSAAQALGTFGTNAQSAVPALLDALQDPDLRVRGNAKTALKLIAPDAPSGAEPSEDYEHPAGGKH